jgi:hypothetical protein
MTVLLANSATFSAGQPRRLFQVKAFGGRLGADFEIWLTVSGFCSSWMDHPQQCVRLTSWWFSSGPRNFAPG